MNIYTKTGDSGKTSLFGGERVDKDNVRIEAYGTIDELNSIIGLIVAESTDNNIKSILIKIQSDLFSIGSELASPLGVKSNLSVGISDNDITYLENRIDELDAELTPLKNFILPGGSRLASLLHFARTVCRRAERKIIKVDRAEKVNSEIIIYINRLSDLLFILARSENKTSSSPEIEWKPRG